MNRSVILQRVLELNARLDQIAFGRRDELSKTASDLAAAAHRKAAAVSVAKNPKTADLRMAVLSGHEGTASRFVNDVLNEATAHNLKNYPAETMKLGGRFGAKRKLSALAKRLGRIGVR